MSRYAFWKYFDEGDYYHVYNRGSEKNDIFLDNSDYIKFRDGLYEYNTDGHVDRRSIRRQGRGLVFTQDAKAKPRLVEVLGYCLMPNHFHLIVRQLVDGGLSKYMLKLTTGYSMYFNKKYKHTGHVFQGSFQCKDIRSDEDFLYVSAYIHLNPVTAKMIDTPDRYPWSSYRHFIGEENNDILPVARTFLNISSEEYRNYVDGLVDEKWFYSQKSEAIID